MTRASLRRGLPYRWWTTDTGTAVILAVLVGVALVALAGAWLRWWGA